MSKKLLTPLVGIKLTGSASIGFAPSVDQDAVVNHHESAVAGSVSDFASATPDVAGYVFGYPGNGRGYPVTDSSASVANGKDHTARVCCMSGCAGAYDHIGGGSTDLVHPRGSSGKRPRLLVGACRTPVSEGQIGSPIRASHAEEAPQ